MTINWPELQDRLYELSVEALREFALEHREEVFYGFIIDCNADYGEVLLCLNTEEGFRQSCEDYSGNDEQYLQTQIRWSSGDWRYQGFNTDFDALSEKFKAGWQSYQDQVSDEILAQWHVRDHLSSATLFLESVCRVLIRMEHNSVFDCLGKTSNFRTFVCDHDEGLDEAWGRLDHVRNTEEDPGRQEKARQYAASWHSCSEVAQQFDSQRRELPFSPEKALLKESLLDPPQPKEDGWWIVYEIEETDTQICYNLSNSTYRISVPGQSDVCVDNASQLVERLRP